MSERRIGSADNRQECGVRKKGLGWPRGELKTPADNRSLGRVLGGENSSQIAFLKDEPCKVSLPWCVGPERREARRSLGGGCHSYSNHNKM